MIPQKRFEKLLEPYHIGPVKTRNRMIKTGASMCYWHEDDLHMSETAKAFYEAIAKGGIGLLIVESPTIDYPLGARWRERYRMDDDRYIKGMSELVQVIHKHGCPTFMQMWHDGPWQSPLFPDKPATFSGPPIGASPVNLPNIPGDFHRDVPRVLTIPEIEAIVDKWASAAVRAQKAEFDGVDINAGSSHLMHNFLSPFWNRRQDSYGGSLENRTRFLVSIIKEIKKRAGRDFPISVLINAIELGRAIGIDDKQCMTVEESRKIAQILQEAGADAIQVRNHWLGYHVGGFLPDYLFYPEPPIRLKEFPKEYYWRQKGAGANMFFAEGMKKVLSIPVIIVGKIGPELGEMILREGKADFIAMTRSLQCDSEFPHKVAAGRLEDIAPCTACGTCLNQRISMARRCRINAAMGTTQYAVEKAKKRKKVVVIGGGPAGMEAARVLALRGHDVTMYEKTRQAGGLMRLAALVKGIELEDLPNMIRYLKTQIDKLGVTTVLGTEVDSSMIKKLKPDVVIVATGGELSVPEISGINKRHVITTPALHRMVKPFLRFLGPKILELPTKFWIPFGKRVVIIGAGLHGCELAEFLVKRKKKVTVVERTETVGEGVIDFRLGLLLDWFQKKGVTMITGVKSMEITDKGVVIITRNGKKQILEADSIVPTAPLEPSSGLFKSLKGKEVPEVYAVGDCKEPGLIVDAIADGWKIANKI
jgi:2,4-dienoyl-CoA reductase (NADPH2)